MAAHDRPMRLIDKRKLRNVDARVGAAHNLADLRKCNMATTHLGIDHGRRDMRCKISIRLLISALLGAACLGLAAPTVQAQGRYFDSDPYRRPYQDPGATSPREARCRMLEQELANDWALGQSGASELPRIDEEMRRLERDFQRARFEADRDNCYEDMFIFGRSLRRTPKCIALDREIEDARRQLAGLRERRDRITNARARRARQDDLVAELARNGCGENYRRQYEANRRSNSFFSLWEDSDSRSRDGLAYQRPDDMPFSTYRTMCVRLCDGFYFPVSFSTLPSKFREDEVKCQQQCSAPAQLFVYRNNVEDVEQMVSLDGRPYKDMPFAFRHRREYIKGCSCKPDEYSCLLYTSPSPRDS